MVHNIQFPALKRTGGTTRDCRSCLQVHDFLLMEGWSAFYRKFLRISSIKDLWAMTRRHSRHSSRLKSQFSSLNSVFSSHPITNKKSSLAAALFYWSFSICVFSKKRKQREVIMATTVASPMPLSCTGPTTMVAPERPEMRVTAERMRFLDLV